MVKETFFFGFCTQQNEGHKIPIAHAKRGILPVHPRKLTLDTQNDGPWER